MKGALRTLRETRGLQPAQVAQELGISVRTIYRHEASLNLNRLLKLGYAAYYGVPVEELS